MHIATFRLPSGPSSSSDEARSTVSKSVLLLTSPWLIGKGRQDCRCYCKNKSRTIFTVCTHADNSNDVKLSKTLQWNTRLRLVVLLQCVLDLNILTSFLWSIRVQTIAICATSETRMKLGRVNFRKAFRCCY